MRQKYVKGYFALSRLLVSDFLLFNVLFWSSMNKSKVPGSQILESWVPGPENRVLCPRSWVPGPGSWVAGTRSWVLNLEYAQQNTRNTRNIKNTCLFLHNYSKLTKTEAAFDKCSTKLGVLQNAIRQSIEHVLLIKKAVNNTFEGFFFAKLQASSLQLY